MLLQKPRNFLKFLEFYKNMLNDSMSGDEISIFMKKIEKLSSIAYGLKNNVYSGTPCRCKQQKY